MMQEASNYFRTHPALMKMAREFCKKYRSLGHFGGTAVLSRLSAEARQELSLFLRRETGSEERVRFAEFSAAWQETRFGNLPLEEFLLGLMPEDFMTKHQERQREQAERLCILDGVRKNYSKGCAAKWLDALSQQCLKLPQKEFYHRPDLLQTVACALESLPLHYERLPFFANRVAGNPHALDAGREAGRIFFQALAFLAGEHVPAEAGARTDLLYRFHILRDDILNFATVYGLAAYRADGREIPYWREATESFAPINIPLREIVRAAKIRPAQLQDSSVYIVENSGVFSALMDELQTKSKIVPLLALHGQLKAASWALLDRLAAGGARFFYSGDLDPEGINIADRILSRYVNAELWHMSPGEYTLSGITVPEERWKKLHHAVHPKLRPVVSEILSKKQVYYQESLVREMGRDLCRE